MTLNLLLKQFEETCSSVPTYAFNQSTDYMAQLVLVMNNNNNTITLVIINNLNTTVVNTYSVMSGTTGY